MLDRTLNKYKAAKNADQVEIERLNAQLFEEQEDSMHKLKDGERRVSAREILPIFVVVDRFATSFGYFFSFLDINLNGATNALPRHI